MPQATRARGTPVYSLPVSPYTHTRALSPFEVPCRGLGRTPQGGGHEEATLCLLPCPILSPVLRTHTMYVAKGGRRRPGLISRLATPPREPSRPLSASLDVGSLGGKLSRTATSERTGPEVDGAVLLHKLHRPPRGGAKCGTFGADAVVWCHQVGCLPTLPMLPPHLPPALDPHPPPLYPPTQDMCMPMSVPVPVGWGVEVRIGLGWDGLGWGWRGAGWGGGGVGRQRCGDTSHHGSQYTYYGSQYTCNSHLLKACATRNRVEDMYLGWDWMGLDGMG